MQYNPNQYGQMNRPQMRPTGPGGQLNQQMRMQQQQQQNPQQNEQLRNLLMNQRWV